MQGRNRAQQPPPGGGPRGPGGPGRGMPFEKPKNAKGTLRRLVAFMRGNLRLIVLIMALSIVGSAIGIGSTRLYGIIIDDYIAAFDFTGLLWICGILLAVQAVNAIVGYVQNTRMVLVSQRTSLLLRKTLFGSMQRLPLRFFDTHPSGDLMSRLTNDVDTISNTLSNNITHLFSGIVNVVGSFAAMLLLSPMLSVVALVTTPLVVLMTRGLAKVMRKLYKKQQADLGGLNGFVEEMVSGQKVIKLFSHEEAVKNDFDERNQALKASATKAEIVGGVMGPMMNMLNNLSFLLVAVTGGWLIIRYGVITVGTVFTFLLYMKNFGRPLSEIANMFNSIQSALAAAERVFAIMDEPPETDAEGAREEAEIKGDVRFSDVTFSYTPGEPVLKHAAIEAKQGQQIAIVGPTGAGKTTIISLLTRFYDKDAGDIIIDGQPIESLTRDAVRRNIGMVLQDTYLFSESVRENIRYGRPDATDEDVEAAARTGGAHSFIRHLPHGYDTVLGDNGGNISQGQRQLLAISRAVLCNPRVLILDEATSNIDTRTELRIQKAMLALMEGRTAFIIAHRLSTIRNADSIIVIDKGEVVETGTHDELIAREGFYAGLYNSQFKTGMAL